MTAFTGTVQTVFAVGDPHARPMASYPALVQAVRAIHPGGAGLVLVGLAATASHKVVRTPEGIIAILIGLLMPAVQRLAQPGSADLTVLKGLLDPSTGSMCIALADGRVHPLVGVPPPRASCAYVIRDVYVSS